jgi:hypothetical protein
MKFLNLFKKSNSQEIGKSISWRDSIGIIFKIIDFDKNGTTIDKSGNLKTKNSFSPYGYLIVNNPTFSGNFKLPIIHKDDFLLASSIFDEPSLNETVKTKDFLVTYRPKEIMPSGLAGILHALHFVITPINTLSDLYYIYTDNLSDHQIESIFINFKWEGEIKVHVNPKPF